jgi:hypothetical protein
MMRRDHDVTRLPEHWTKLWSWYVISVALILLTAGVAKSIGIQQSAAFLSKPNSIITFFTNRHLFWGISILEIGLGALLLTRVRTLSKKTKTIFWISSQFAIYRIGLWLISEPEPCKCFGDVFRWIGASDDFIRAVTIVSLLYILIPSGMFWVFGLTKVFKNKSGGTA